MYKFELLGSASIQQTLNPLADIALVLLPFEGQEDAWRETKSFCHGNDGIETWHFLASFNVPPKVRSYVPALCGFFEAEASIPSKPANTFSELGAMSQCLCCHTITSLRASLHSR